MKRALYVILAAALLLSLVFAFAGCKQKEEKAAAAGEEEKKKEIVLTFPTFWVGQDSKAEGIAALVEEFNSQNEGEIRVVIEPNPDTDGYRDKLNTQLATGSAPDIFVFNPDPTTFQYYESDILMDFTDELKGSWGEDFVTSYLKESTKGGVIKSVPFEIGITPLWYNMDLLKQAGVNEVPKSWDDFMAMAKALKAEDITPTSQMTGGSNAWTSMLWYSHLLASLGGPDVWSKPLTDPIYVEAAEYMKTLYSDGNTTRDAVGGDAGVSGGHYMAGDTAVFINGPWYIGRIKSDAPETHAATKVAPAPKLGEYSGHQIGFLLSNLAAGNTDDPDHKAAVVKFMKFVTDPANVKMLSESAGSLFAIKYELGADADPLQKSFVEVASNASFVVGHFQSQYPIQVVSEFGQALSALALGKVDAQGFVDQLISVNN